MRTTICTSGLATVLATTLLGCLDEDPDSNSTPWTIAIDGVPATCAQVGAQEVAFKLVRDDSAKYLTFPCDDGSATTTSGDERWLVGAFLSARGAALDPVPLGPVVPIDQRTEGRRGVAFPFGTLTAQLQPAGASDPCGAVGSYDVNARADGLHLAHAVACGRPVVLPEGVALAIDVVGWIDTGGGDRRACHRTREPVLRSAEGEPAAVPVPFNPAPDDVEACAPFAPDPQPPHRRSQAIATTRSSR